jgi:hypothetical protein
MIDEKRLTERFDQIENRLHKIERHIRWVDARGEKSAKWLNWILAFVGAVRLVTFC